MSWHGVLVVALAAIAFFTISIGYMINMPGSSRKGDLPLLTDAEREITRRLRRHVQVLARDIGGRSSELPGSLTRTVAYLERELESYGYTPSRHTYGTNGNHFHNIEARGAEGTVIVGAHYDTAGGLPGANDNASGVAAALEIARTLHADDGSRNLRFVFFANEEPPHFQSPAMGSFAYAKRCHENGEQIKAMLSLETIAYYSDEPGSQRYPIDFHPGYPNQGNFLAFVSNIESTPLLRRVVRAFRSSATLPSEGAAAPAGIPGVGWSDHWSFWQFGYRAIMVTDTAPFRYPYYHTAEDTPEKLDYERMARAVVGLQAVILNLAK
jgi:Zn-dependent M28 family amino/carboxypeptidase